MNTKQILITVLGLASTATWGPLVWDQVQASHEPAVIYPEADEAGMLPPAEAGRAPLQDVSPSPTSAALQPEVEDAADELSGDAPMGQLDELIGALEVFSGGRSAELTELLDQRPVWLETPEEKTEEPVSIPTEPSAGDEVEEPRARQAAEVSAYLEASPLTAIVRSESSAWAMLGGRIVREGDVVLPKLLKVKSISKGGVTLSSPTGDLHVPLPPFQVRTPPVQLEEAGPTASPEAVELADTDTPTALDPS